MSGVGTRAPVSGNTFCLIGASVGGVGGAALASPASPEARALCAAVAWTLEQGAPAPELSSAAMSWAATVPAASQARSALLCLGEVAGHAAREVSAGIGTEGLEAILDRHAGAAVAVSAGGTPRVNIDQLTGGPTRAPLHSA